jgi:hypothetical protein
MHKNATKYNETLSKWCKNKHRASKIMDTLETYHQPDKEDAQFSPLIEEGLARHVSSARLPQELDRDPS